MDDKITVSTATQLGLSVKSVAAVIQLLDGGATVPFISRYRKEATGNLDEVAVRSIEVELARQRALEERRTFVIDAIATAGVMTPNLQLQLSKASTITEIEDIYAPFRPRRRTRAAIAREKGLEPLAKAILEGRLPNVSATAKHYIGNNGVTTLDDALAGASDIIAEIADDTARLRNITRRAYDRRSAICASIAKGKDVEIAASPYASYAQFSRRTASISSHQYLALRRAEREGLLKLKFDLGGYSETLVAELCDSFAPRKCTSSCRNIIEDAVSDAFSRLLTPSVENEVSARLKDEADKVAINIFSDNLRQLLLSAPLKGHRVLALDPGFRTGCKVVALDAQGTLLDDGVIYAVAPRNDTEGAIRTLRRIIANCKPEIVAIGNGTASRETEHFVRTCGLFDPSKVFIVNESGASVYSASEIARKEFPDKDVTVRGAVSIGRRLIDPLAELVKIDPKAIGVGQYQHDVDQKKLKESLDYTVMSCVNAVGVDVNTASPSLLSYISGIGPSLAENIVKYRTENGSFTTRSELRKVPRFGDKAFEQSAGFLRVTGGKEPLDNTGIHPESYRIVSLIARSLGVKASDLPANGALLDRIDTAALVASGISGKETLTDIIAELRKPGRDVRLDNNEKEFHGSLECFEDLHEGMTVEGKVENITAFGAFVNLGIHEKGLIHISELSHKRVASIADVLHLGQVVTARVIGIDSVRKRISLSLK